MPKPDICWHALATSNVFAKAAATVAYDELRAPRGLGRRRVLLPEQALLAAGQLHIHRLVPAPVQRRARHALAIALQVPAHLHVTMGLGLRVFPTP